MFYLLLAISKSGITFINVTHCDTRDSLAFGYDKLRTGQIVSIGIIASFVVLVTLGTFFDFVLNISLLKSFSLSKNFVTMFKVNSEVERFPVADILRVFASAVTVVIHSAFCIITPMAGYVICKSRSVPTAGNTFKCI